MSKEIENIENEIWKDIPGYEGFYQASSLGRIKSLDRMVNGSRIGVKRLENGRILKTSIANNGYYSADLYKNSKRKTSSVHQLIAMTFLNHTPCRYKLVVNHINLNKLDNSVSNLEIITNRENSNMKHIFSKSKYIGVSNNSNGKRWVSHILYNSKRISLGVFDTEQEASEYYQNALKAIKNGTKIKIKRNNYKTKYKNVFIEI